MIEKNILEKSSTSSNLRIDVFQQLEPTKVYVEEKLFSPQYPFTITGTEGFFNASEFLSIYGMEGSLEKMVGEMQGYPLPPRRKFKVILRVRKIKKGIPSFCNEIEEF